MYDKNIMNIALNISKTSQDPSAQVAAVITNQLNEILSVGVNNLSDNSLMICSMSKLLLYIFLFLLCYIKPI